MPRGVRKVGRAERRAATRGAYGRGERTRERVVLETIRCLQTEGFQGISTSEVARRAGLSWGTLQYHFSDKDGLLAAALEYSCRRLREQVEREAIVDGTLRVRVRKLVDIAWKQFMSEDYRVMLEVLANVGSSRADFPQVAAVRRANVSKLDSEWDRIFADVLAGRERIHAVRNLVFAALRGLAVQRLSGVSSSFAAERTLLVEAVVSLLSASRAIA